jgi:putative nucleotidyltransferase with HDIG domain
MDKVKTTQAEIGLLTSFIPFSECSEDELIVLADHAWVDQAEPGHILAEAGSSDNWDYYLIEGTLKLVAADGRVLFITGGSRTARAPISHLQPRQYTLSALTPVKYLRVDVSLLKNLSFSGMDEQGMTVAEAEESEEMLANPLYAEIHNDLINDRLVVPSMPEVAMKIRRMIEFEDAPIPKLARLVQSDPAISAKLIKSANGSLYHGQPPVESCSRAIARLGLNTTKHLVVSFVLRNLFQEKVATEILRHRAHDLWQHSVEVAAISMALAQVTPELDAEAALLAGLLHDIGELVILTYAEEFTDISSNPAVLDAVIAELKAEIGRAILHEWQFPEPFCIAASEAENWLRDSGGQVDYGDAVVVAHLHSYFGTARMAELPPLTEVPAFGKLAEGRLTPEVSMRVLDEARERIHEVRQLLLH